METYKDKHQVAPPLPSTHHLDKDLHMIPIKVKMRKRKQLSPVPPLKLTRDIDPNAIHPH